MPQNIPNEITTHERWVVWKYCRVKGKWTKVPVNPKTGENASSTDPSTWGTFLEALAAYNRDGVDGIGYVVDGSRSIVGIDLDSCETQDTGDLTRKQR